MLPSQSRQTKNEPSLAKWVCSRRQHPEEQDARADAGCAEADICWGALNNPRKAQSRVGALTFFSAGLALSPGSSLHYKTSDTKASGRY